MKLCMSAAALMLLSIAFDASADAEVFTSLRVEGSSEPVPIHQMINGWEDNAYRGDYAYADGVVRAGVAYDGWSVGVERRYHYLFKFSPDTVAWYEEVEQGADNSTRKDIDLDVQMFDARGVFAAWRYRADNWSVQPSFTIYRLGHYQWGDLTGKSSEGEGTNASAYLDYYFDEDKILKYEAEEGDRFGYSLSVSGDWQIDENWFMSATIDDLWNRLDFLSASHRTGCINVGEVESSVCQQDGVSGKDQLEDYTTSFHPTLRFAASYSPYQVAADFVWHGPFHNLTLWKDWQIGRYKAGVSASSLRQLGFRVSGDWFSLSYAADDLRIKHVRDTKLEANLFLRW